MMKKYPKINSIFKRDDRGRFTDEYSQPEFELLKDMPWEATEKIDGTNIRIGFDAEAGTVEFGGRTDKAKIQKPLLAYLEERFTPELFSEVGLASMVLFGEGYGGNIQKAGPRYRPTCSAFILFDVYCGHTWLRRNDVDDIAHQLQILSVPVLGVLTLDDAICRVSAGFNSLVASDRSFGAEGMILRAPLGLLDRMGRRIITKVKTKDFRKGQ